MRALSGSNKARLLKQWGSEKSIIPAAIISQELVWNFVMCTGMTIVGSTYLIQNGDFFGFFCNVEPFLFLYFKAAEYAARFADTDAVHKIFWTVAPSDPIFP